MATGYTRNDTTNNIANGNIIDAADLDGEFDAIQAAYDATTGHTHDGTVGGGAPIGVLGPTQDIVVTNTVLRPKTDNTVDLGSNTLEFKDLWIDGTANIDSLVADTADINGGTIDGVTIGGASAGAVTTTSLVATTADINGGTIDGATIATSDITVGTGKTLNVSAGTLTLANDQISGDKVEGGTINAITINTLGSTTGNITNVNATTIDTTNLEVTAIKAKDGTAAAAIANSTGVVTIPSSVLTTTDINGGTIDGATIATSDITVGSGKTLNVSAGTLTLADNQISGDKVEGGTINAITITTLGSTTGNITNVNATTVDTTNLEVTAIKAKDGTAAATIADSTGVVTVASSVLTTADINGGTIDGTTIGGSSAAAGTFTNLTATGTVNLSGATVSNGGSVTTVDINGGTIDGVTIGGASAGAITGTTITATGDVTIPDKIIHAGDTNTSIRFPAADTVTVETSGAERLRVNSSGNVGIGTSSPGRRLDVVVPSGTTQIARFAENSTALPNLSIESTATGVGIFSAFNTGIVGSFDLLANGGASYLTLGANGSERMRIDSAGNVGIGVTPSAWASFSALQLGETGSLASNAFSSSNTQTFFGNNVYFDGAYKYIATGSAAAQYLQIGSEHQWLTAPSGTAGDAITFTQAMTLDASGRLGIGTTSPAEQLHITGNLRVGSAVLATPSGSTPMYTARAWVNFNGTGTVAIRASGNVSSVTDNGVGDYTLNFTTAMPDTNYAPVCMMQSDATRGLTIRSNASDSAAPDLMSTTQLRIQAYANAGGGVDIATICVAIFR